MFIVAAAPVKVVIVLALIAPDVLPLRVFNVAIANDVSLRVTASPPNPLIPLAVRAVFTSDASPVNVLIAVAVIVPVVLPFKVFKADAATEASVTVIA